MKFSTSDYPYPASTGRFRIDVARRLRIEEYFGKVELADLKSIIAAMISDPDWSPEFNGLVDFTGAEMELSSNDVLRLALMLRQKQNRSHGWLVFVVGNSVAYGVVRMLGYWSKNTDRFRIFHSREEAEAWLDKHLYQSPPAFAETAFEGRGMPLATAV